MVSFIRRRISYANLAVTAALVFAMAGGAVAAVHSGKRKHKYVVASTTQIAPAVLRALKGAQGSAGEKGAQGPTGEKGVQGLAGEKGAQGLEGKEGKAGAPGETPKMIEFKGELGTCKEGGTEFVVGAKPAFACNGKEGAAGKEGKEGQPWTPNNTLPSKATDTGAWVSRPTVASSEGENFVSLSFFIPLPNELPAANAIYITGEENRMAQEALEKGEPDPLTHAKECPGIATAPKAAPGFLCVYASQEVFALGPPAEKIEIGGAAGTGPSTAGALIRYEVSEVKGFQFMYGTFAVTAE